MFFKLLIAFFSDYNPINEPSPSGYDIALLKLKDRLTFNSFVQWAYVTGLPNPSIGTQLTAAGWGITEQGSSSSVLKSVSSN